MTLFARCLLRFRLEIESPMSLSASLPSSGRSESWRLYFRPKVVTMLLLGFSSGLPFMLVGNTLAYWLRDAGISLTTIGFLA